MYTSQLTITCFSNVTENVSWAYKANDSNGAMKCLIKIITENAKWLFSWDRINHTSCTSESNLQKLVGLYKQLKRQIKLTEILRQKLWKSYKILIYLLINKLLTWKELRKIHNCLKFKSTWCDIYICKTAHFVPESRACWSHCLPSTAGPICCAWYEVSAPAQNILPDLHITTCRIIITAIKTAKYHIHIYNVPQLSWFPNYSFCRSSILTPIPVLILVCTFFVAGIFSQWHTLLTTA